MKIKGFGDTEFTSISTGTADELRRRLRLTAAGSRLRKTLKALPTGSKTLDRATGEDGLPRGTLAMIGGASLARNRALALSMVASAQLSGGRVVVVDSTKHLWKSLLGHAQIDESRLAFLECPNPVESIRAARKLCRLGKVDLVLVGPLAGAAAGGTPAAWMVRNQAMADSLRDEITLLGSQVKKGSTAVVVLHGGPTISSPVSQLGRTRKALEDAASYDFLTRPLASDRRGKGSRDPVITGGRFQVDVIGASSLPAGQANIDLNPGGGVSTGGDLLEYGLAEGMIHRRGSVYKTLDGASLGRGREAAKAALEAYSSRQEQVSTEQPLASGAPSVLDYLTTAAASEDGESRAETKQPPGRSLNTWFEGPDDDLPPLVTGRTYDFKFQIARRKTEKAAGQATDFVEPDFGEHLNVSILATLYSDDFDIDRRHHQFWLDRVEDSVVLSTEVIPRTSGIGSIRLVLSLQRELEILQAVRVEVEVVEEGEG